MQTEIGFTDFQCCSDLCKQQGFSSGASSKEPACQFRRHKRHRFRLWVGKISWRRAWKPTPIFLPRESHGQRSLVDYSPLGCTELDTTEVTYPYVNSKFTLTECYQLLCSRHCRQKLSHTRQHITHAHYQIKRLVYMGHTVSLNKDQFQSCFTRRQRKVWIKNKQIWTCFHIQIKNQ